MERNLDMVESSWFKPSEEKLLKDVVPASLPRWMLLNWHLLNLAFEGRLWAKSLWATQSLLKKNSTADTPAHQISNKVVCEHLKHGNEFWKFVLWFDEANPELFGQYRCFWQRTNIMVSGWSAASGTGNLGCKRQTLLTFWRIMQRNLLPLGYSKRTAWSTHILWSKRSESKSSQPTSQFPCQSAAGGQDWCPGWKTEEELFKKHEPTRRELL